MAMSRRSGGSSDRLRLIGGAVVVALILGGALWLGLRSGDGGEPSDDGATPRDAVAAPTASEDSAPDLPPLETSDELVRRTVAGLSSRPELAEWLATEDLARRFVGAVVQVAAGRSPRDELETLEPEGSFEVRERDTVAVIDPAAYDRYDPVAATVASLDTEGTAELYRRLRPLFREAYRDLGFSEGTFEGTLARAVEELLAVPVPEGPVHVVPDGATAYAYRDPALEELSPAQKHLLRMGPENIRRVQGKLGELSEALELPVIRSRSE